MAPALPLPPARRRVTAARAIGLAAALLLAGCASSGVIEKQAVAPEAPKPAVAAAPALVSTTLLTRSPFTRPPAVNSVPAKLSVAP